MKPINNDWAGRDVPDQAKGTDTMTTDKSSLSYRAGYDAFMAGKALVDDPQQLFENWAEYQVGFIDAMAQAVRQKQKVK